MKVRKVIPTDKERMLTSFKPLFGDWDYLPLVIDDWLSPPAEKITWVAESGDMLVAMGQAAELEPGDWYLNGLRSNPRAPGFEIAVAILGMRRAIANELKTREVKTVRYGTLYSFAESLRMGGMFGFREHFRLAHSWHQLPDIPPEISGISVQHPNNLPELLEYFLNSSALVQGYFFTWWDTRKLRPAHLEEALQHGLLFEAQEGDEMTGAAMFYHVPWQNFLVLSILEGSEDAIKALYREGVAAAHELNCNAIGMVHPSADRLHHRQKLLDLNESGCDTVQLILGATEDLTNLDVRA